MVAANQFPILFETTDLYASSLVDPVLEIKTYYEQQWLDRGITIKYIQFVPNKSDVLIEPDIDIENDAYRSFGRSKKHNMDTEKQKALKKQ